jgi:hypothetical protein
MPAPWFTVVSRALVFVSGLAVLLRSIRILRPSLTLVFGRIG